MPACTEQIDYTQKTTCKELTDFGEDVCSSYGTRCKSFLPSWLGWICSATEVFCQAFTHIANWVCTAWNYLTKVVCIFVDIVTGVVNAILGVAEVLIGTILRIVANAVSLVFSIPVIGPILNAAWNAAKEAFWTVASIPDAILGFVGILPEKRLRICAVVLIDGDGDPVVGATSGTPPKPTFDSAKEFAMGQLQNAAKVFKDLANVRLICPYTRRFNVYTGFQSAETVRSEWVTIENSMRLGATELDQQCDEDGFIRDLGTAGSNFELLRRECCDSYVDWRTLWGYGEPVIAFFIRS